MKLHDILQGTTPIARTTESNPEIDALSFDSRTVRPGTLFFALSGSAVDGHSYIESAIERGASAIVCERMPEPTPDIPCIAVNDTHEALGTAAANFYGHPSRQLRLVGVTGTNGKTTIATLLYDLFRRLGYRAGLISTVVYRIDERTVPSTHTTPDAIRLQAMMREMVDAGCDYCFMEVSSHSIVQRRIDGLHFAGAIFTNLTHDHLDYHKTFAEYLRAKKRLFDGLSAEAFALTNADDRNGCVMTQNCAAQTQSYSLRSMADFRGRIIETHPDGMLLSIDGKELWVHFLGRFNASNLLAVYGAARLLGADRDEVLQAMSMLVPVNGRFETLRSADGVTAIVDYAHTPDALQNVIATINEIRRPGQHLTVVVGCGGDRDRTKRPEMARIAVTDTDLAILTSDNPRTESPEAILAEMRSGLTPADRAITVTDRREAIRQAVMGAAPGDIILVAGKGHETYQDVGGVKSHFDDKEEVRAAFDLFHPHTVTKS